MRNVIRLGIAVGLLVIGAATADYAPAAPDTESDGQITPTSTEDREKQAKQKAMKLPPITVMGTRLPAPEFNVPAAISVITQDEIVGGAPAFSLAQSLARVPGIVAQNRQSYAQGLQLSIRGFGARASYGVRGIRILVDGIPVSRPDGQSQTDSFNLAIAERIEVLRGPFSALYGNAAGGVIQIFTKDGPPQPTLTGSTLFGSYATRIQRLGFGGTAGNFSYIVNGAHFYTRGYREHSEAERYYLHAKFRYKFGVDSSLMLLLQGENQPFAKDPSSLTRAQVQEDPGQARKAVFKFGAGEKHWDRLVGIVYDQRIDQNDRLHLTAHLGTRRVLQFLPFHGDSPRGGGAVIDLDNTSGGGSVRWIHNFSLAGAPLNLIAGFQYERLHEQRKGWVNDRGIRGAQRRNEDNIVTQIGEYLQAEWQPGNWRIIAGLRHSRVRFESDDHYITPENPDDSGTQSFSSISPVAGILYEINPYWNVYANYGRGFQTPTLGELVYRPGGGAGFNGDLQPSTSHNYEVGLKARWNSGKLRLALFRITTADEIIVAASHNGRTIYRNAASTKRHGLELTFQDSFAENYSLYFAYSYLRARFDGGPLDGKDLPGVPQQTFYTELDWRYRPLGLSTSLSMQWRDRVYVNDPNTAFADSYWVANFQLRFEQTIGGWQFTEFARVNNLFDSEYIGAVVVNAGNDRFFQSAPGHNVMLGLSASYMF